MRKTALVISILAGILVFSAVLVIPHHISAQYIPSVTLTFPASQQVEVYPGANGTAVFNGKLTISCNYATSTIISVKNQSAGTEEWIVAISPSGVSCEPGTNVETNVTVTVWVPPETNQTSGNIELLAETSTTTPGVSTSNEAGATIQVQVKLYYNLSINCSDTMFGIGDTIYFVYQIVNNGSAGGDFYVTVGTPWSQFYSLYYSIGAHSVINISTSQSIPMGIEPGIYYGYINASSPEIFVNVSVKLNITFDYDNDGMLDTWEIAYGLDPTNASDALLDLDNDGLTNVQEYLNGTNPRSSDTDGDQLGDAFELIFSKTDPTKWDTDGDGRGDGLEFTEYSGSVSTLPEGYLRMTISWANYTIYIDTNSSVLEGRYDKDKKCLRVKVHGPPDTVGVANLTIPKAMVGSEEDIKLQLDGHLINYTLTQNATHYWIYVEYTHSTHELAARFSPIPKVTANKPTEPTTNLMKISWSQTIEPGDFAGYEIYRSTSAGVLGTLIYTETNYANTTYTVTNLSQGITYYFTVRTIYQDSFYADSNQVSEKTLVSEEAKPSEIPWLYIIIVSIIIIIVLAVVGIGIRRRKKALPPEKPVG